MTAEHWLSCTDPTPMLEFVRASGRTTDRKLRLFAVACCRRVWHLLNDARSRRAVEVAECHADAGAVGLGQAFLAADFAGVAALEVAIGSNRERDAYARFHAAAAASQAAWDVAPAAATAAAHFAAQAPAGNMPGDATDDPLIAAERAAQADLLRDFFDNPFRSVALDPAWLTWNDGAVVSLAQTVYDDRDLPSGHLDTARLVVLADMLQQAGCCDAELQGHLRGPAPHIRGCHSLDLLLGKV